MAAKLEPGNRLSPAILLLVKFSGKASRRHLLRAGLLCPGLHGLLLYADLATPHRLYGKLLCAGLPTPHGLYGEPRLNVPRFPAKRPHSALGLHLRQFHLESRTLPQIPSRK
jgi:hypothetical protein